MGIPTISDISPNHGSTRGRNIVDIAGTNFSMPPDPPLDSSGPAFQSIKVMFGSLQSPEAFAITPTRAIAVVPTYEGDEMGAEGDSVDVTLYNLDSTGAEIPGEEIVFSSYLYNRPLFTDVQVLEYIMGRFVSYLRRHVTPNVWVTMGRSYSEGEDQVDEQIKAAQKPLIWINGVDTPMNNDLTLMGSQEIMDGPTNFNVFRPGTAVNISMPSIQIYSGEEHPREIFALCQAMIDALKDVPHLNCNAPAFNTEESVYNYPMSIPRDGMPSFDLGPEVDGLKICRLAVTIEEVSLTELAGTLTNIGWTVEEDPEIDFVRVP